MEDPTGPDLHGRNVKIFPAERVPVRCPDCGSELRDGFAGVVLTHPAGNKAHRSGSAMFCPGCPVVAFDAGELDMAARLALPDPGVYGLMGFIDWDQVPEDKSDAPIGREDNPVPLVEFASIEWLDGSSTETRLVSRTAASSPRRLAGRKGPSWNAPCPCGSGAKYKKCCGGAEHAEWTGKAR